MKKAIAVTFMAVIFLLCGCAADSGSINVTSVPQASRMVQDAQASVVNFTIPREMKVFVRPDELTPLKPLFGSYLKGNDMLLFAVSAVFDGSAYLMGFVYENNEGMLPFSRVIGLKQNGTGLEEAFISDNYKPDPANIPENLIEFMDEPFYDTQAFKIGGMLAVKTNECLEVDEGLYNFFLISEDGLLDNHIDTDLNGYCELFEYNGKLLLNENYIWYEFTVKNKKITLKEITDYKPYLPEISKSYFVITINDFNQTHTMKTHANISTTAISRRI